MQKLSKRKTSILEVIDAEIADLEEKLEKVQPLLDELTQLKRTRATLLSERSVTGNVRSGTRLTMEQVIHAMRENDDPMTPQELGKELGVDETVVRSHLNRYKDVRYAKNGDGAWRLIGADPQDEDDDEEEG
jgi:response regulator of citrate/malate metabolism